MIRLLDDHVAFTDTKWSVLLPGNSVMQKRLLTDGMAVNNGNYSMRNYISKADIITKTRYHSTSLSEKHHVHTAGWAPSLIHAFFLTCFVYEVLSRATARACALSRSVSRSTMAVKSHGFQIRQSTMAAVLIVRGFIL